MYILLEAKSRKALRIHLHTIKVSHSEFYVSLLYTYTIIIHKDQHVLFVKVVRGYCGSVLLIVPTYVIDAHVGITQKSHPSCVLKQWMKITHILMKFGIMLVVEEKIVSLIQQKQHKSANYRF